MGRTGTLVIDIFLFMIMIIMIIDYDYSINQSISHQFIQEGGKNTFVFQSIKVQSFDLCVP